MGTRCLNTWFPGSLYLPCYVQVKISISVKYTSAQHKIKEKDIESARKILNLTSDIIKDTDRRTGLLMTIQKKNSDCAPFEIGYLTYNKQEKYRRMIDKYNISVIMRPQLYLLEMVLYLEEIEHHFWEINHISNMMHEIERKYDVEGDLNSEFKEEAKTETPSFGPGIPSDYFEPKTKKKSKRTKTFKIDRYISNHMLSTRKRTTKWWPLDYGWEIDYYW